MIFFHACSLFSSLMCHHYQFLFHFYHYINEYTNCSLIFLKFLLLFSGEFGYTSIPHFHMLLFASLKLLFLPDMLYRGTIFDVNIRYIYQNVKRMMKVNVQVHWQLLHSIRNKEKGSYLNQGVLITFGTYAEWEVTLIMYVCVLRGTDGSKFRKSSCTY